MTVLTKEAIFKTQDAKIIKESVGEWGGDLYIRVMSGTVRNAYELEAMEMKDSSDNSRFSNLREKLLVKTLCNEKGELLFSDDDIEELSKKSSSVIDRLFKKSQELNGLTGEEGNLETTQGESSISD